jgi:hypothetical protein
LCNAHRTSRSWTGAERRLIRLHCPLTHEFGRSGPSFAEIRKCSDQLLAPELRVIDGFDGEQLARLFGCRSILIARKLLGPYQREQRGGTGHDVGWSLPTRLRLCSESVESCRNVISVLA